MGNGIRISKKHGVNPALGVCSICGNDSGEVILFGYLPGDKEAPHRVNVGSRCKECDGVIKQDGVMIIECRDGEKGQNPYRTGRVWGITGEAFDRIFRTPAGERRPPCAFIHESAAKAVGFTDPPAPGPAHERVV